jgi:AGCS family alanine or glycine:cation symporter
LSLYALPFLLSQRLLAGVIMERKPIEYLFGARVVSFYKVIFSLLIFVGATMSLAFVWNFSDVMNGMMVIPNLIGILLLVKILKSETNRFFK